MAVWATVSKALRKSTKHANNFSLYMVHLIYTYLTLFSVLVSYLYKLDNI